MGFSWFFLLYGLYATFVFMSTKPREQTDVSPMHCTDSGKFVHCYDEFLIFCSASLMLR